MHGNHAGDGHTALLAAGKAERRPFGKCFIIDPREAHGALYSFFRFLFITALVLRTESNIFCYGFFKELMLGILENHAHRMALHHGFFCLFRQIHAVYGHLPHGRMKEAVQVLYECRLAAPRMADDTDELPLSMVRSISSIAARSKGVPFPYI